MNNIIKAINKFWTKSILRQLILGIALVHAILMSIFVFDLVQRQRDFLQTQSEKLTLGLSQTLATNSVSWVLARDFIGMEEIVLAQAQQADLVYAMILSPNGKVLAHTEKDKVGLYSNDSISHSLLHCELKNQVLVNNSFIVDIASPIYSNEKFIGWARVGMSQEIISTDLDNITTKGKWYILIAIIIGSVFAIFMGRGISSGIRHLLVIADRISKGDEKARISLNRSDELGQLGNNLNNMFDAIIQQKNTIQKSKDELLESELNFKAFTNQSIEGISVADIKGNYSFVNPAFCEMVGWSEEELLKMTVFDVTADKQDTDTFKKTKTIEEGKPVEVRLIRKDGSEFLAEVTGKMLKIKDKKSVLGTVRDITERKKSEIALTESEKQYRLLFDLLPYGGEVINSKGIIIKCSPNTAKMLGYNVSELIGKNITNFINKDASEMFKQNFPKILKGESATLEICMLKKDGSKINVLRAARPIINSDGKIESILALNLDITERIEAEKALERSRSHYKTLFENSPIPLWEEDFTDLLYYIEAIKKKTDLDLGTYFDQNPEELFICAQKIVIKDVNNACVQLHNAKDKAELLENLNDIFTEKSYKVFKNEIIAITNGQLTFEAETEIKTLKGDLKHILVSLVLKKEQDGTKKVIIATPNITKRKKAEEEIKKLSTLVTQSPTIITITNLQGNLEYVNTQFTETTGYSFKEAIGQNPRILKSDKHPQSYYQDLWRTISAGMKWKGEIFNKKKNGDYYWELANIFPIFNQEGEIINYTKESQDITRKKETDQLLQDQTQELLNRNEDLDAFSHTVAHDLKNPLAVIAGFSNLLQTEYDTLNDEEIQTYIKMIIKSGSKAQEIIKGLLLLANVRKSDIQTKELKMQNIVEEAINRLSTIKTQKNAEIKLAETWPKALGNAIWVEEIWVNMISNAIKYGGESPQIEIGAESNKIGFKENGMAYFWVKDEGDGISEENQKMLFKKFERFDQVKTEGHGLGLSIVRNIVEKLGGQVGVTSTLGKGSLFYFTLPLKLYEPK